MLSPSESKRKQSKPQKVVSPNSDGKNEIGSDGEDLPGDISDCDEEKPEVLDDHDWSKENFCII